MVCNENKYDTATFCNFKAYSSTIKTKIDTFLMDIVNFKR